MKKVYLIHSWGGNPKEAWFPWLRKELDIFKDKLNAKIVILKRKGHIEGKSIKELLKFL